MIFSDGVQDDLILANLKGAALHSKVRYIIRKKLQKDTWEKERISEVNLMRSPLSQLIDLGTF